MRDLGWGTGLACVSPAEFVRNLGLLCYSKENIDIYNHNIHHNMTIYTHILISNTVQFLGVFVD